MWNDIGGGVAPKGKWCNFSEARLEVDLHSRAFITGCAQSCVDVTLKGLFQLHIVFPALADGGTVILDFE